MSARDELLSRVNAQVPPGVDWKAGAQRYVQHYFATMGRDAVRKYSMTKPFAAVADESEPAVAEFVHYINNFSNAIALLRPKRGARVLDVACGGGWVSHFLAKLGYRPYGIDLSADFIDLARERLASDPELPPEERPQFAVHDIETAPLSSDLDGSFDIVWLESCLHHFVDPVSALEHLARALAPDGVMLLIEYENRRGPIKEEYLKVMRETDTLEWPYARAELVDASNLAGVGHVEFMGTVNGWFSPDAPTTPFMGEQLVETAKYMNLAVCAKHAAPLDALFPHRRHRSAIRYGRGFSPEHGGYRWSAPASEIRFAEAVADFRLTIHSTMPVRQQQPQLVVASGPRGELARATLTVEAPSGELVIGAVQAGDVVDLHSADGYRPSWTGSDDDRLLSFYVAVGNIAPD